MGRTPEQLAEDKIFILKANGERSGPHKAAVNSRSNRIEVFNNEIDAEVGDTVLRPTAPRREEVFTVVDVHYKSVTHGVFAPFELDVKRQGAPERARAGEVSNIYNTNSQNVQIGDYNVQNVMGMLQGLVSEIDKADVPAEQKNEARRRLQELLTHPVVTSIMGGAAGSLIAKLTEEIP